MPLLGVFTSSGYHAFLFKFVSFPQLRDINSFLSLSKIKFLNPMNSGCEGLGLICGLKIINGLSIQSRLFFTSVVNSCLTFIASEQMKETSLVELFEFFRM